MKIKLNELYVEKFCRSDSDDLFDCYEQSESPEIIESFLKVIKSMPIIDEKYDSIYSDEEIDDL